MRSQVESLFQQLRDIKNSIFENNQNQKIIREQINHLIKQLRNLSRPDYIYTANIEADLMISKEGEYEVIFDYIVPNALWRPIHQVRLLSEAENLH